jgi:transcriptional regulator with XRE-family HTH domain
MDHISDSTARLILANSVRQFRLIHNWSQELLGFEAGVDRTFISHVERGVRNISIDNIERLAIAMSLQTYQLLMPFDKVDAIKLRSDLRAKIVTGSLSGSYRR